MADLGEEAFSSQMKVVATFLRLLEELMRNKQQDLRYGTKTQRRGILGRMKDFVGGIFKKVYDGTFGRLSRNGKDYGQLDLNDPAVASSQGRYERGTGLPCRARKSKPRRLFRRLHAGNREETALGECRLRGLSQEVRRSQKDLPFLQIEKMRCHGKHSRRFLERPFISK